VNHVFLKNNQYESESFYRTVIEKKMKTFIPVLFVLPLSEAAPSFSSSRILIFCVNKFTEKHVQKDVKSPVRMQESTVTTVDFYFKRNIFPSVHYQDIDYQNILFLMNCVTQSGVLSLSHNITCYPKEKNQVQAGIM